MLLRGVDRQIGLTERINAALVETRHFATMYGFEHAASSKDIYRVSEALVERFIAGFASHRSSVAASTLPTE